MSKISKYKARYADFRRIQRRDGFLEAVKRAKSEYKLALLREADYQTEKRVDLEDRWEIIKEHIASESECVLDIGCNQGELTRKTASCGLFSLGVDVRETYVEKAQEASKNENLCNFLAFEVSPENARKLPEFDTIFILTVYYHWGNQYGWENAEDMLQTAVQKTDQLFFETPKQEGYIQSKMLKNLENDEAPHWQKEYLRTILNDSTKVEYIGETDYEGGDRDDLIFLLEG